MKKTFLLLSVAAVIVLLAIGGYCLKELFFKPELPENVQQNGSVNFGGPSDLLSPSGTVEAYLKYTLGSIPEAELNYEKAKNLLTPNLQEEFDAPGFVPNSYCIQDGPQKARVFSSAYNQQMNWNDVRVQADYGSGWVEMWNFKVVPVEGDQWRIYEIECLMES